MRHCMAVANVALTIAQALNEHGFSLDMDLIKGAGLSHDAARVRARHWDVMADRLAEMGYPEESIMVVKMDVNLNVEWKRFCKTVCPIV